MRMEHKNDPAKHFRRPRLDAADGGVTVFHRKRETAGHEWRAHAIKLARRHAAGQHQPFGAAADGAVQRADANLARPGFGKRLIADFSASGADIPKRFGGWFGHFFYPALDFAIAPRVYPERD